MCERLELFEDSLSKVHLNKLSLIIGFILLPQESFSSTLCLKESCYGRHVQFPHKPQERER